MEKGNMTMDTKSKSALRSHRVAIETGDPEEIRHAQAVLWCVDEHEHDGPKALRNAALFSLGLFAVFIVAVAAFLP